jgi:hypothetical protein
MDAVRWLQWPMRAMVSSLQGRRESPVGAPCSSTTPRLPPSSTSSLDVYRRSSQSGRGQPERVSTIIDGQLPFRAALVVPTSSESFRPAAFLLFQRRRQIIMRSVSDALQFYKAVGRYQHSFGWRNISRARDSRFTASGHWNRFTKNECVPYTTPKVSSLFKIPANKSVQRATLAPVQRSW